MSSSMIRRLLAGCAVFAAVLVALPSTAWAHVNAAGEARADGTTQVTFSFTHGCEEAPTTTLRVQLPGGTTEVSPQDPAGWSSQISATELAWTGGSIPNGALGSFVVTMRLTGKAGDTIFFPTIQACPGDLEDSWLDKSDDPGATNAAPRIKLAATNEAPVPTASPTTSRPGSTVASATSTTPTTSATTSAAPAGTTNPSPPAEPTSSGVSTSLLIGAAIIVLIFIGVGGYALSRRGSSR